MEDFTHVKIISNTFDTLDCLAFSCETPSDAMEMIRGYCNGQQKRDIVIVVDDQHMLTSTHMGDQTDYVMRKLFPHHFG